MNRDPRLLYGADIRRRILDEVAADIARLATRRKVGHLVRSGSARLRRSPSIFADRRVPPPPSST